MVARTLPGWGRGFLLTLVVSTSIALPMVAAEGYEVRTIYGDYDPLPLHVDVAAPERCGATILPAPGADCPLPRLTTASNPRRVVVQAPESFDYGLVRLLDHHFRSVVFKIWDERGATHVCVQDCVFQFAGAGPHAVTISTDPADLSPNELAGARESATQIPMPPTHGRFYVRLSTAQGVF